MTWSPADWLETDVSLQLEMIGIFKNDKIIFNHD